MWQNNRRNYHHDHIQKQIMVILNETLRDEIYDNVVKLATFTETRLTSDYSTCTIFVDTYNREKIDNVLKAVKKAKGVFKTQLAKKMTIKKIPDLIFVKDCSIDQVLKIEKIIQQVNKK